MRLLLVKALMLPFLGFSQIYFQDKETIDLNITIKEPFKPINYAEIGNQFNDVIQQEIARRNALKQYHNDIFYQTRDVVMSSVMLTGNTVLNQKILLLQEKVLERMSMWHTLLSSGQLNPNSYPNKLKNEYYNFFSANKILLSLYNFINNNQDKDSLENYFEKSVSCINDFEFNNYNVLCEINGIAENLNSSNKLGMNDLYRLIINSADGKFNNYRKNWTEKKRIENERYIEEKRLEDIERAEATEFNNKWKKIAIEIIECRDNSLKNFQISQRKTLIKNEKKIIKSSLSYRCSKNQIKLYLLNIQSDIEYPIKYSFELNNFIKIPGNSTMNFFYDEISKYWGCDGNLDSLYK
tara:strand:+ start:5630 stop:6688 length:1059 start_codon:yes stop_codon:yes gene_type:complete